MAVNINQKSKTGAKILRTPAPDEITHVRSPSSPGYGMNGPQPSAVAPGVGVRSVLGQNLVESGDDGEGVLQKIIEGGVAGRDDRVPADGNTQTRTVSAEPYKTSWGDTGARPAGKIPGAK
jgi:hypothetical protein